MTHMSRNFKLGCSKMEDLLSLVLKKPTIKNAIEAMDVEKHCPFSGLSVCRFTIRSNEVVS